MELQQFLDAVASETTLDRQGAHALSKATLQLLGQQVNRPDMEDLLSRLPAELTAGVTQPASDRLGDIALGEFHRRVTAQAGLGEEDQASDGVRAVFAVLSDAAGLERLRAAVAPLHSEYQALLPDT